MASRRGGDDDDEVLDRCPICLEPMRGDGPTVVHMCRHDDGGHHLFHRACLVRLLGTTASDACPVCRRPCLGLRRELLEGLLASHDYETAFGVLVGGAGVGTRRGQRARAVRLLGEALGLGGDAPRFWIVVELLRRAVRREGAATFLAEVCGALGLDPDARVDGEDGGSVTPLQWLLDGPRRGLLRGASSRYRAVRLLLALGADADEARSQNDHRPTGDPRIDLSVEVAVDVARVRDELGGDVGGFVDSDFDHLEHLARRREEEE